LATLWVWHYGVHHSGPQFTHQYSGPTDYHWFGIWRIATPSVNQATATGNIHKNWWSSATRFSSYAYEQSDTQTDILITILHNPNKAK